MNDAPRYIVRLWYSSEVRECVLEDGFFVHVLNSSWRIAATSPKLREVKAIV